MEPTSGEMPRLFWLQTIETFLESRSERQESLLPGKELRRQECTTQKSGVGMVRMGFSGEPKHPNIQMSSYPDLQMSKGPDVQRSAYPDIRYQIPIIRYRKRCMQITTNNFLAKRSRDNYNEQHKLTL